MKHDIYKLRCCLCGKKIHINQRDKVVKKDHIYIGWRHEPCHEITDLPFWYKHLEEAGLSEATLVDGIKLNVKSALAAAKA